MAGELMPGESLMKRSGIAAAMMFVMVFAMGSSVQAYDNHRFGAGVRYWIALEDIDTDKVDENGFAYILSYQYQMAGFSKLEGNIEYLGKGYAGSDDYSLSPQVYFLVGRGLYGGLGVGITYSDGEFADKAYFALRVGIDFEILPAIFVDINVNYRFEDWDSDDVQEDIDTDTVTLGAIVRLEF